jgi:hypothetical protein
MATPKDVARWMLDELRREEYLYQEQVVCEVLERFGDEFTYYNDNGNLAISRRVLDEFRKLTAKDVVWVRSDRYWRIRNGDDPPGVRQVDY